MDTMPDPEFADELNQNTMKVAKGKIVLQDMKFSTGLRHEVQTENLPEIVATLLSLPTPVTSDRKNPMANIPVYRVGQVEVSENSSPRRLRTVALDYLAAANLADTLVRDAEEKRQQEEALNALKLRLKAQEANALANEKYSKELFASEWSELRHPQRRIVEKYRAMAETVEKLTGDELN